MMEDNEDEFLSSQPSDRDQPSSDQNLNTLMTNVNAYDCGAQNMQSLFVIAEEDASQIYSEDMHSNYQAHNGLQQYLEGPQSLLRVDSGATGKSSQSRSKYLQGDIIHKSKSLGLGMLRGGESGQQRNTSNSDDSDQLRQLKQDFSPRKRLATQEPEDNHNLLNYNNKMDSEQMSQYFAQIDVRKSSWLGDNMLLEDEEWPSGSNALLRGNPVPSPDIQDYLGQFSSGAVQEDDQAYWWQQIRTLREELNNCKILLDIKKEEVGRLMHRNGQLQDILDAYEKESAEVGVQAQLKPEQKDFSCQIDNKIRPKESHGKKSPNQRQRTSTIGGLSHSRENSIELFQPAQSRKASIKNSPHVGQNMTFQQNQSYQNASFTSEEMKSNLNQQQVQIQQLKSQLANAVQENLNYMDKLKTSEDRCNYFEDQLRKAESQKIQIQEKLDEMQLTINEKQKQQEGLQAENFELRKNLDTISSRNSPDKKREKGVSTYDLCSMWNRETQTPPPGFQLAGDQFLDYENEALSTFSSQDEKDPLPVKKDYSEELQLLFQKASEYEKISIQLQQDIQNHKKSLKHSQDKQQVEHLQAFKESTKKKLKRRERKIEKLEEANAQLLRSNGELRKRLEEAQEKNFEKHKRMEMKLAEKEFKILALKQQMSQLANSGVLTPVSAPLNQQSLSYSTPKDMVAVISDLVKQQMQQYSHSAQQKRRPEPPAKQRAKSSENPHFGRLGQNHLQERASTVVWNEEELRRQGAAERVEQYRDSLQEQRNGSPLQDIFHSSIRRINQELESIIEQNSMRRPLLDSKLHDRGQSISNTVQEAYHLARRPNQKCSFEDSLQGDIKASIEEILGRQGKVFGSDPEDFILINQKLDEKIRQLKKRKRDLDAQGVVKLQQEGKQQELKWRISDVEAVPTFVRNSEAKPNFDRTQLVEAKQSESFFYDLHPQFDNSNTSSLEDGGGVRRNPFCYKRNSELRQYQAGFPAGGSKGLSSSNVAYESNNPNSTSSFLKDRVRPSGQPSLRELSEIERNSLEEHKSEVREQLAGVRDLSNYKQVKKVSGGGNQQPKLSLDLSQGLLLAGEGKESQVTLGGVRKTPMSSANQSNCSNASSYRLEELKRKYGRGLAGGN